MFHFGEREFIFIVDNKFLYFLQSDEQVGIER